jgi:hypothetical protein
MAFDGAGVSCFRRWSDLGTTVESRNGLAVGCGDLIW